MKKIIDIHSHILPGVDDGCKTREEALEMLSMYEEQNVEAVICTPHYGPCGIRGADVKGTFNWLQSQSRNVKLYLGSEIHDEYFDPEYDESTGQFRLAGSRYYLIEFEEWAYNATKERMQFLLYAINHFTGKSILAHPERYRAIQEDPEFCKKLAETGIGLQINAYDVFENNNPVTVKTTRYLLENRLVTHVGSDAHGMRHRPPALAVGVKWIYDHCPEDYADAIVHDNAKKIIRNEWERSPFPG